MIEPKWVEVGRKLIGTKEIPGPSNNPVIMGWFKKFKLWFTSEETPWCGIFVAHCMQEAIFSYPKEFYRAKEWLTWGETLTQPMLGCIVIFNRDGGGHVGFSVGKDERGRLLILGGNQGNSVSIAPFDMSRVAGYRFPSRYPFTMHSLPTISSTAQSSQNES